MQYTLHRQRGQQAVIFNTPLEEASHIFKAIYVIFLELAQEGIGQILAT